MKKRTRLLCILTTCIMAASLTGCKATPKPVAENKAGDLKSIIPKDTVTLTVFSELANFQGEQTGWYAKILKDKFNVKLNIIKDANGVFATRMESGNLGDIIVFPSDPANYNAAVKGNALLDWEKDDLIKDYGPYIKDHMQAALDKNKTNSNGHLYGFGGGVGDNPNTVAPAYMGPDIRWDLYKKLGYPQINTLEDYVGVLADMQKLEPVSDKGKKTYGVSLFKDWDGNMPMMVKATAGLYGWDEFGFGLYNVQTGEYQDTLQKNGQYLRMLKFYNTLYQKGLFDPDSMTKTWDDEVESYKTGAAFLNVFQWMCEPEYNTPDHTSAGKVFEPVAAKDEKVIVSGVNIYGGSSNIAIGAKTQYPELCMAILNWMSSPEGYMITSYGPKGVTWDYDKKGSPYFTDLGNACQKNGDTELTGDYKGIKYSDGPKTSIGTWDSNCINPDAKDGASYSKDSWTSVQSAPVSSIEQDWRTKTGANNLAQYLTKNKQTVTSYGTTYTATQKSNELTTTWNQVKDIIVSTSWKAIYAKNDAEYNSIVDSMISNANAHGYADCVKYQQNEAKIRKGLEDKLKK